MKTLIAVLVLFGFVGLVSAGDVQVNINHGNPMYAPPAVTYYRTVETAPAVTYTAVPVMVRRVYVPAPTKQKVHVHHHHHHQHTKVRVYNRS